MPAMSFADDPQRAYPDNVHEDFASARPAVEGEAFEQLMQRTEVDVADPRRASIV